MSVRIGLYALGWLQLKNWRCTGEPPVFGGANLLIKKEKKAERKGNEELSFHLEGQHVLPLQHTPQLQVLVESDT